MLNAMHTLGVRAKPLVSRVGEEHNMLSAVAVRDVTR